MPIHDNTNRGVLFKNLDKEDSKHADFNGNLNVNGKEFWLNAWSRTSKNGVKYLSLSIKPKEAPKAAMAKSNPAAPRCRSMTTYHFYRSAVDDQRHRHVTGWPKDVPVMPPRFAPSR